MVLVAFVAGIAFEWMGHLGRVGSIFCILNKVNSTKKSSSDLENDFEDTPAHEWALKESHPRSGTNVKFLRRQSSALLSLEMKRSAF